MAAKKPKKTAAQLELEALQLRQQQENERTGHREATRAALMQRDLRQGRFGYNQFMFADTRRLPAAQAGGAAVEPNLTESPAARAERLQALAASSFSQSFKNSVGLLAETRKPRLFGVEP